MTNWTDAHRRLHKSAQMLKAFYEAKLKTSIELLTETPKPEQTGDVRFARTLNSYGLWGFRPARTLSGEDLKHIAEMSDSILGGFEDMHRQREELERLEVHLSGPVSGELPSNVIAFQRRSPKGHSNLSNQAIKQYTLRLDCLIESPSLVDIHKMAMELHEHSARVAFVHFWELNDSLRTSISQLFGMGAVTLYIPSILKLSALEQEVLRHIMAQNTTQRPLLMVGTPIPYSELARREGVDQEFLTLLVRAYIKLTKPFSEYKDQGLIHYFLDSLSSSPT